MGFIGDVTNILSQGAGVMSPLGSIAGGVSALGSLFSKDNSMALAEKQHQWDVEENEKNRQFQADQWQHQFDETNRYNSPKETAKRLREGGLNANAILNGQGSAIGQSSASPSAPSGASGLNPMPDVVSQVGWQSKESLMKRLSLLGDLSKNSYLLPETKQKLSADIKNTLADERFKQVRADAESYMLQLDKLFKPIERKAGVASALSNMALAVAETKLSLANGEVANENKLKIAEERLLTIAKRNLSEKDLERLKIELKWLDKEHEQSVKESKSRESSNYASANQSNTQADVNRQLRRLNSVLADVEENTKSDKIDSLISEYESKQWLSKADAQEARVKLNRLKDVETRRDQSNLFKEIDSFTDWLKSKVTIFH